jgi:Tol biopolymer transport system component
MVTRRPAFLGDSGAEIIAKILKEEPPSPRSLNPELPAKLEEIISKCLDKDRDLRYQIAAEVRTDLKRLKRDTSSGRGTAVSTVIPAVHGQDAHPTTSEHKSSLRRTLSWVIAGILVCLGVFAGWWFGTRNLPPATQPVIRFAVAPTESPMWRGGSWMSLSPDGRHLAFAAQSSPSATNVLWVRSLDDLTVRPIRGTEGGYFPFWSPDGKYLGFYANGKLKKVAISGGAPQTLCDAEVPGATWGRSGVILFTTPTQLSRVPEDGGTPKLAAAPDRARHELYYRLPQFLPDGHHFLFLIRSTSSGPGGDPEFSIAIGSLDSKEVKRLSPTSSSAFYSPPGYLLYMDQATLMARPFDTSRLQFTGKAVPVTENVKLAGWYGYGFFAVSQAGELAYQPGTNTALGQMVWLNRKGEKLGTVGEPGIYANPALSPDGTKLAVDRRVEGKLDIWTYDLKRGTASRLTFNADDDLNPVWSADGSRIFFTSTRQDQRDLYQKASNGVGKTEPVFASRQQSKSLNDLSPDGRYAIYDTDGSSPELWVLPLFGERKPFAFVQGKIRAQQAQISPDGRFVAYTSQETGSDEIYVQTFPQHLGKWQISTNSGQEPMWRQDGKELFYFANRGTMMAVDVSTDSGKFQAGVPHELFEVSPIRLGWRNHYVVSPDGQRFLMLVPAGEAKPEPITVVVNWPALLKKQ